MKQSSQLLVRILVPLAIVGAGFGVQRALVAMKTPAEAKAPGEAGVVVVTQRLSSRREQVTVPAQGTVVPAREIALQPEVAGRIIQRNESLVVGGTFEKGEVLLRIDEREYSLRARQSAQELAQAEQQLKLEQSRGTVAEREWSLVSSDGDLNASGRDVALRKPQLAEAEARIELAQSSQDLAQLNVGRTVLRAPFNGMLRSGQVQVGQYVTPGVSLGMLVGSDKYWVQVSVPVERLKDIRVPGFNAEEDDGSTAVIWQNLGQERIERPGRVVRLYGDLDPVGRLARVLVEIDDPLSLDVPEQRRGLPLLLGAYVHVDISGHEMESVIEVPRSAVHAGRYVYLYGPNDRLVVREVEVAWRKPTSFLVRKGLSDGDELIVSRLGNAVEGLKLRRAPADGPKKAMLAPEQEPSSATGSTTVKEEP